MPKLVFRSFIPKLLGVEAIVLYPFIFFRHDKEFYLRYATSTLKHEFIHINQIERMGVIRFYLSYIWEYIKHGYHNNKYEVEARDYQDLLLTDDEIWIINGRHN